MIHVISSCLQSWLAGEPIPSAVNLNIDDNGPLFLAYTDHAVIGWNQWFKCRISKQWREVYMNNIHSRIRNVSNGPRILEADVWAVMLIVLMPDFGQKVWQISNFPNNYLQSLTEDSLQGLPMENLKMTESQFQIWLRPNNVGQNHE
jgi:hypothetical protein